MISQLLEQGGWVLAAIFVLSTFGWTLLAWKYLELRRERAGGWRWVEPMLQRLRSGDAAGAAAICERIPSVAGRLAWTAVRTEEPERRFFERHIQPALHSRAAQLVSYLSVAAVIGAASTLLGLLGTVLGMITTFRALTAGGASVATGDLAGGISQALITTQAGLVVALPIVFFHRVVQSMIRTHMRRIELTVKMIETIRCHD
jgi:biopolymer transport protein ExbB